MPSETVHPTDYNLLGMKWRDQYYFDKCMPMGCSSSCRTFELFSSALEWVAQNKLHINHIIHLLDDFLIIAASQEICQRQLTLFVDLCGHFGVPIAPEKTCGPATTLSFAGIELDTIQLEARLPAEKNLKCKDLISDFLKRKKGDIKGSPIINRSSQFCMFSYSARQSLFAQTYRSHHWHPVTVSFYSPQKRGEG